MPLPHFYFRKPVNPDFYEPIYRKDYLRALKFKKLWLSMNEDLINELITDRYFDIYTRNGFEFVLKDVKKDCKIFLVDFDDIRGMNKKIGYTKVNDILKKTFSELKDQYIIGRAFSGDEIFFLTYDLSDNIDTIKNVCLENNLTFTHIEETHYDMIKHTMGTYGISFHKIPETLEKMIENFH